jgi:hypothetical protein
MIQHWREREEKMRLRVSRALCDAGALTAWLILTVFVSFLLMFGN